MKTDTKHYQVEVEKNGCERCGEGKMWVIVANGIAGCTSYGNEDEAVELCDELNDAFDEGRVFMSEALKDANDMCRSAMEVAKRDGKATNWETFRAKLHESLLRQHAIMYPQNDQDHLTGESIHHAAFGDSPLTSPIE